MNATQNEEMTEIFNRVKAWSPTQRITLARRILETLEASATATAEAGSQPKIEEPTRGWPVERVLGLLKTDREPPDDEECRRIIEEERWKKYGS
jgi:hypothetical protein